MLQNYFPVAWIVDLFQKKTPISWLFFRFWRSRTKSRMYRGGFYRKKHVEQSTTCGVFLVIRLNVSSFVSASSVMFVPGPFSKSLIVSSHLKWICTNLKRFDRIVIRYYIYIYIYIAKKKPNILGLKGWTKTSSWVTRPHVAPTWPFKEPRHVCFVMFCSGHF